LASNFSGSYGTNYLSELENLWAKYIGTKYAVGYSSGTTTLHGALHALGVGRGDEVLVPALNVIMTSNAVVMAGAIPVFVDVCEDTFCINPEDAAQKMTRKTKAMIPVAFYGQPCDMNWLKDVAVDYDSRVIEDNAQAVGSLYKGHRLGSIGDIASFSFESSKCIAAGTGGILTTSDKEYYDELRSFRFHGYKLTQEVSDPHQAKDIMQDPTYERHEKFGWSYVLPELCAAVLISQVQRADWFVQRRVDVSRRYQDAIIDSKADYLIPQVESKGTLNGRWTYAVRFIGTLSEWRSFRKQYMKNGGDGIYGCFQVVYNEPVYRNHLVDWKASSGHCEVAEKIQPQLMQFANNYGSVEEAELKVEALRKTIKDWR
jgi:perosamine synthetase